MQSSITDQIFMSYRMSSISKHSKHREAAPYFIVNVMIRMEIAFIVVDNLCYSHLRSKKR